MNKTTKQTIKHKNMEEYFRRWERQQDELGRDLAQFINRHPYITAGMIGYFLLSIIYIDIMRNW